MRDDKKISHESFGQIQINRVTGGKRALYASSIEHGQTVSLKVYRSEQIRGLNSDWFTSKGLPIIEIEMSHVQFAEAMSGMNTGSGTPVTIVSIEGTDMEACPQTNKVHEFDNEFKNHINKITENINDLVEKTKDILSQKKAPNKSEKESIIKNLQSIKQEWGNNLEFINKMFTEQMQRTVLESKGEVEGFILNKIQNLGLESLKELNIEIKKLEE